MVSDVSDHPDQDQSKEEQSKTTGPGPKTTGVVLTLLMLGFGGYLFFYSGLKRPVALAEWGDFLAGGFAPIAFIWLVIAVFIQSSELRAQRHELALNRAEFKLNREVLQSQVEEAKKQAEYIGRQTQFLEEQRMVHEFERALARLASRLRHYQKAWSFQDQGLPFVWRVVEDGDIDDSDLVIGACIKIAEYTQKLEKGNVRSPKAIRTIELLLVFDAIRKPLEMAGEIGSDVPGKVGLAELRMFWAQAVLIYHHILKPGGANVDHPALREYRPLLGELEEASLRLVDDGAT